MNENPRKEEGIKERESLIKKEKARLTRIYKNIEESRKKTITGLIERAAFMGIVLKEMEVDLNENGWTEPFQQGNQPPYDRKRPIAEIYGSMNTSYQKIIKQLTDLLPKTEMREEGDDGFESFVAERDEMS